MNEAQVTGPGAGPHEEIGVNSEVRLFFYVLSEEITPLLLQMICNCCVHANGVQVATQIGTIDEEGKPRHIQVRKCS